MSHLRVYAPATTANLGPGFDSLGLALDLWNWVDVTVVKPDSLSVNGHESKGKKLAPGSVAYEGEGADELPTGADNLIFQAVQRGLAGDDRWEWAPTSGDANAWTMHLRVKNGVPLSSGLGSSATAIVAGLLIANEFRHTPLAKEDLLQRAYEMEGHPDNVAAALMGGLTVSAVDENDTVKALSTPLPDELWVIVAVPDFYVGTHDARATLPTRVSRRDAVFNISRAALWVMAATTHRWDMLTTATDDALHQPYRKALIPGLDDVFAEARAAGALGIALSGSGPSVASFSLFDHRIAVGEAMSRAFKKVGVTARIFSLRPTAQGAYVEMDDKFQRVWAAPAPDTRFAGGL